MRFRLPLSAPALAAAGVLVVAGAGAADAGVRVAKRALFAVNAGKVGGIAAARTPQPGKLVPLGKNGKLPASVIPVVTGAPGANGEKGESGAKGDTGAAGPKGDTGAAGANGANGTNGANGATGATGPAGPLLDTLPSGKSESGTWALNSVSGTATAAISFSLPLTASPTPVLVPGSSHPTGCPGSISSPTASAGYLCIYEGASLNVSGLRSVDPATNALNVANPFGTTLMADASGNGWWTGSWAVTAP